MSISVQNRHRSSILCYVIKHIPCLAPISYRKSDIDVMRNVDVLWIQTEITALLPPPAKSWTILDQQDSLVCVNACIPTITTTINSESTDTFTNVKRHPQMTILLHIYVSITTNILRYHQYSFQQHHRAFLFVYSVKTRTQRSRSHRTCSCVETLPLAFSYSGSPRAGQTLHDGWRG